MDDDFLYKSLVQASNCAVSEYPDTMPFIYTKLPSFNFLQPGPDLKYMKKVFKRAAENILDSEVFTDQPEFTLLEYTFRQPNPHLSVFLPTYLFLK